MKLKRFCSVMAGILLITSTNVFAQKWWQNMSGPAYQVLVYSFADSDGDGWGDIRGLIGALDYLNDGNADTSADLGVEMLWLSPIHPSASYHGYDVIDFMDVSPQLGTITDFEKLVSEAHKRGIKIILDIPFNHTSTKHPWFQGMLKDPKTKYSSYYKKRENGVTYGKNGMGQFYSVTANDGTKIEYFSAFWDGMPDLDVSNKRVVGEFIDILAFWLDIGVDGFRFDAAKHIFDPNEMPSGSGTLAMNREFWSNLRNEARKINPDVFFIGEVLTEQIAEINAYAPAFDSLFEFNAAKLILNAASSLSMGSVASNLQRDFDQLLQNPSFLPAPLLSNHDQDRSMSIILQKSGAMPLEGLAKKTGDNEWIMQGKDSALMRAKIAASMYHTVPGIPFIYYGEEIGLTGTRYLNDDVSRRDAFVWTENRMQLPMVQWAAKSKKLQPGQNSATDPVKGQTRDEKSLLNHYRKLSALRASSSAVRTGSFKAVPWAGYNTTTLSSWLRENSSEKILVVHNAGAVTEKLTVPAGMRLLSFWDSITGVTPAASRSEYTENSSILVPAGESVVYTVK